MELKQDTIEMNKFWWTMSISFSKIMDWTYIKLMLFIYSILHRFFHQGSRPAFKLFEKTELESQHFQLLRKLMNHIQIFFKLFISPRPCETERDHTIPHHVHTIIIKMTSDWVLSSELLPSHGFDWFRWWMIILDCLFHGETSSHVPCTRMMEMDVRWKK